MSQVNEQILLVSRPQGEASVDNFKLVQTPLPSADELSEGQVLVRHHYLSLDPYMRGRMNDSKSYAEPQPLNSVMLGGTVGEVLISKHPKFAVGDKVAFWNVSGMTGLNGVVYTVGSVPSSKTFTLKNAANNTNGTVGRPGTTMPTMPIPRLA